MYNKHEMRGTNKCAWIRLGKAEVCGKSCMGEYCKMHSYLIRKGGGTIPCEKCGIGVKTYLAMCKGCGVDNVRLKKWREAQREIVLEFRKIVSEWGEKYPQWKRMAKA